MDYLIVFAVGVFLGISLGWDHVKPQRKKSPRRVAQEIEEAAEQIERIQRDAIDRMRRLP